MAGRGSVWSDPELRALVVEHTVPCADEVWRLQRGEDAECRAFQTMADAGHYGRGGGTRQGIYLASPSGRLLASINSLDPATVKTTLQDGLAAWDELDASERRLPADSDLTPAHRWEQSRPVDGLVLVSHNRDLSADLDPAAERLGKWNRDHAWFTAAEAGGFVPETIRLGEARDVPGVLTSRLARFHVVDNVSGQTLPFGPNEVAGSTLRSEVLAVDGKAVQLRLTGLTRAVSDGTWTLGINDWRPMKPWPRGVQSRLLGYATWDTEARRFTRFELVAQGVRWGASQYNGRMGDPGPGSFGVVFELAPPDDPSSRVAPGFIDVYDADWVVQP